MNRACMVSFRSKSIATPPAVSEQLRLLREERGLSLATVAKALHISLKHLDALETGAYEVLPGMVYGKSFVRAYSNYLDIPADRMVEAFRKEYAVYTTTKAPLEIAKDSQKLVQRVGLWNMLAAPTIVRNLVVASLVFVCLGYLGTRVYGLTQPPQLNIDSPVDNMVTTQSVIAISGTIETGATLEINGQVVIPDQQGYFSEVVVLQDGPNSIEITAQKKHSEALTLYRNIMVVDEQSLN